jgi:hypothetical protein
VTSCVSYGQVSQEWVVRYNGSPNAFPDSFILDNNGNIYVVVSTSSNTALLKYDKKGRIIWTKNVNAITDVFNKSITLDDSNNVYLIGRGSGGIRIFKYNPTGALMWNEVYVLTGGINFLSSIFFAASGNIYICGTYDAGGTFSGIFVLKYDRNGTFKWQMTYGSYVACINESTIDQNENIYMTGSEYYLSTYEDYFSIKIDSGKNIKWIGRYVGGMYDEATSVSVDKNGYVFVTGYSRGSPSNYWMRDFCTLRYDYAGDSLWTRYYNGPGNSEDIPNDCVTDDSGNVYVTGWGEGNHKDYETIKYDANGNQVWVSRYDGYAQDDYSYSITIDRYNNLYITGESCNQHGNGDITTIKYNQNGVQQWVQRYNSEFDSTDWGVSVLVDSSLRVYVLGWSWSSSNSDDIVLIKYSQPIGIQPISSKVPNSYVLSQNYPNPFNPTTKIKFDLPVNVKREASNVKLIIYDILGRDVATLVNEQLKPGSYEVEWDATNYPSGVYFYKLQTESFSETKKMVLVK